MGDPRRCRRGARSPGALQTCRMLKPDSLADASYSTVYMFVGSILLDPYWAGYASGAIVGIIGIAYVVLEFLPQIEPPSNMREADAGWGAEQV